MSVESQFYDSFSRLEKTALLMKRRYRRLAKLSFDVMEKHCFDKEYGGCECDLCRKTSLAIQQALK